jgi:hypothetical protein
VITLVDPCAQRRDVLISAMVRAGYAWSVRHQERDAWREMARMVGVVMAASGPGRGPTTVEALIDALQKPLAETAPELFGGTDVGEVRVLKDGDLNDEVLERCCEHVVEVLAQQDFGARWLPSWCYMRAELVERDAFHRLYDDATEKEYTGGRKFLIEHPAGVFSELRAGERDAMGLKRTSVEYEPIPTSRLHQGLWWWPCPTCRYPMRVEGSRVWCGYGPHQAEFYLRTLASSRGGLLLARRDEGVKGRTPAARAYRPEGEEATVCVPESVWRHIVISGVTELELFGWLERQRLKFPELVEIELFPGKDAADIRVAVPRGGYTKLLDVKDVFDATRLAEEILNKPLAAEVVVLPDFRGETQVRQLRELLPGRYTVSLISEVKAEVEKAVRRAARASR